FFRYNFPLIMSEIQEQFKLLVWQFKCAPFCCNTVLIQIDLQPFERQNAVIWFRMVETGISPYKRNDPGYKLLHIKWLCLIIIRPGTKATDFAGTVILSRQHQNWNRTFRAD